MALLGLTACRGPTVAVRPVLDIAAEVQAPLAQATVITQPIAQACDPTPTWSNFADPVFDDAPLTDAIVGSFGAKTRGAGSQSLGTAQNGSLQGGLPLQESASLRVLPFTRQRGFFFGTGELTGLLQRAAATVADEFPGTVLRVGNLSRECGGDIPPSVSHNSGRDADVLFYAFDRMGGERQATAFIHYDSEGIADGPAAEVGRLEFDTARNWTLVRHLLSDPSVVVQWIFVAVPLRNRLLDYALRQGEPETLRQRATRVLVQPRDSSPHADHFHVRIACPGEDRPGCIDGYHATALARAAQVDALLEMYEHGTPGEQRYARELLSLPQSGQDAELPPIEGDD